MNIVYIASIIASIILWLLVLVHFFKISRNLTEIKQLLRHMVQRMENEELYREWEKLPDDKNKTN